MNRKRIIALMMMISLAFSSFSQGLDKAKEAYDQGNQFSKDLNFAEALKSYEETIRICTKLGDEGLDLQTKAEQRLPRTYFNLGKGFIANKNYTEAITNFEKSLQFADQVGESTTADTSRTYLAGIYTLMGNNNLNSQTYDEAIENYNTALSYKSSFYKAYYGLGLVYREQENLPFMKEALDKAIAMAGSDAKTISKAKDAAASAYQKTGAMSLQVNNYTAAVQNLTNSLEYANNVPRTYFYLAIAYNGMFRWDEAIASANKALEFETGEKSDIYFELGKACEKKGNADAACNAYKQVTTGGNAPFAKHLVEEVLKCK